jgi:AraC-like DNA-binding protein
LHFTNIELGVVEVMEEITHDQREHLKASLHRSGLELIEDKRAILIDKIQNVIIGMVHYDDELPKTNFSDYLSEKLDHDYTYLANLFSETKGITIEHYIILHKIERVKELIIYNELNLSEIAWKLHYSSVAHLSYQFKKVTGLTPSFFKSLKLKKRNTLENV